jgi:hypothetical protein
MHEIVTTNGSLPCMAATLSGLVARCKGSHVSTAVGA